MRFSPKLFFIFAVILILIIGVFSTIVYAWPDAPTSGDMLGNAALVAEINKEWDKSQSGDKDHRHEEGGWIVQCRSLNPETQVYTYSYLIVSVPPGGRAGLTPGAPPNLGEDYRVVGFKHTHPNPPTDEDGTDWDQGPSDADKRWHERHGIPGIIRNAAGLESFGPASGTFK